MDFQTPIPVVHKMISMIPRGVKSVLEPTPGEGNIRAELLLKKYEVTAPKEFFDLEKRHFDCVVMNPPFTPMKLGYQILFDCMEMSDNVIALMPWLTLINGNGRTNKLREFGLKSVTHLPRSIFKGARVQACIIELDKFWNGETKLNFYNAE